MRVLLFGQTCPEAFFPYLERIISILRNQQVEVRLHPEFSNALTCAGFVSGHRLMLAEMPVALAEIDLVISIGGDGTMLKSVTLVRDSQVPVVGINSGRLGFLANISKNEIDSALMQLFAGEFEYEYRSLIEIVSDTKEFAEFPFALNEITVQKRLSSMVTVRVDIDGEYLSTYLTDGLIVSTPTGSTAYSLSVGGPIVFPSTGVFTVAPIAGHNLSMRPVVVPDTVHIRLQIESRQGSCLVTADNRCVELPSPIELLLRKSDFCFRMVRFGNNTFSNTIRNKLMWGADVRN